MTNIELWNQVKEIYFESSLATLRKEFFKWSNYRKSWRYSVSLLLFCVIIPLIIIVFTDKETGYWANFLQIVAATIIFIKAHKRSIEAEANKFNLLDYSFFEKNDLLRYGRFYKLCIEKIKVDPVRLNRLVEWQEISQSKFDILNRFLGSKIISVITGAIVSLATYVFTNNFVIKLNISEYAALIYVLIILVYIVFSIYFFSKTNQQKGFEISKLLQMYLLDTNIKQQLPK